MQTLPLSGGHRPLQAIAMPKTPWKPRVTLMAEESARSIQPEA